MSSAGPPQTTTWRFVTQSAYGYCGRNSTGNHFGVLVFLLISMSGVAAYEQECSIVAPSSMIINCTRNSLYSRPFRGDGDSFFQYSMSNKKVGIARGIGGGRIDYPQNSHTVVPKGGISGFRSSVIVVSYQCIFVFSQADPHSCLLMVF